MSQDVCVRRIAAAVLALALTTQLAACSGSKPRGNDVTFVVSAPVSTSPWIARFERNGAELAAAQLNASGGISFGGHAHHVRIEMRDNGGSPQQVVADARAAVAEHAAALIIDGVGAKAVAVFFEHNRRVEFRIGCQSDEFHLSIVRQRGLQFLHAFCHQWTSPRAACKDDVGDPNLSL